MHNINRTVHETSAAFEQGFGHEFEQEYNNEYSQEYEGEYEDEYEDEYEGEYEGEMSYEMEVDYGNRILNAQSEQELMGALTSLAKRAWRGTSNAIDSPTGRSFIGAVTPYIKTALPDLAEKVLGSRTGSLLASDMPKIMSWASRMKSKADNWSNQEQEFGQMLSRFVFNAAKNALNVSKSSVGSPQLSSLKGMLSAARRFAPGLANPILNQLNRTQSQLQGAGIGQPLRGRPMNNEYAAEFENGFAHELANEMGYEYEGEYEGEYEAEYEYEYEDEYEGELMNEALEMELAAELLAVRTDAELDQFMSSLLKRFAPKISQFANSSMGKMLKNKLKGIARVALPMAGKALGSMVGGPVGGMIGGKVAGFAGKAFGLELEGLSPEDREFETARGFLRFAGNALGTGARMLSKGGYSPMQIAKHSLLDAAKKQAPGWVSPISKAFKWINNPQKPFHKWYGTPLPNQRKPAPRPRSRPTSTVRRPSPPRRGAQYNVNVKQNHFNAPPQYNGYSNHYQEPYQPQEPSYEPQYDEPQYDEPNYDNPSDEPMEEMNSLRSGRWQLTSKGNLVILDAKSMFK
jgi:hypothetical protein